MVNHSTNTVSRKRTITSHLHSLNCMSGVMVGVIALSVVDHGFDGLNTNKPNYDKLFAVININ